MICENIREGRSEQSAAVHACVAGEQGATQQLQIQSLEADNKGLREHVTQLEAEMKGARSEAERQVVALQGRAAAAESQAARLEAEADSLGSQLADLKVAIATSSL